LRALGDDLDALTEGLHVLLLRLNQLIDVRLGQAEIGGEFPQHVDI
jgi:hypothetical protein